MGPKNQFWWMVKSLNRAPHIPLLLFTLLKLETCHASNLECYFLHSWADWIFKTLRFEKQSYFYLLLNDEVRHSGVGRTKTENQTWEPVAHQTLVALQALPWQVRDKTTVGLDPDLNFSARFLGGMGPDGGPSSLVPSDADLQKIGHRRFHQSSH